MSKENKKEIKTLTKNIDKYVISYNNTKNLELKNQISILIYSMEQKILKITLSYKKTKNYD